MDNCYRATFFHDNIFKIRLLFLIDTDHLVISILYTEKSIKLEWLHWQGHICLFSQVDSGIYVGVSRSETIPIARHLSVLNPRSVTL